MLPISITSIFCEDIREEKSGGEILVGIMPDNINVSSFPFIFPKFSIYTRVNLDPKATIRDLSIWLRRQNGEEVSLGTLDPQVVDQAKTDAIKREFPIAGLIFRAVIQAFPLVDAGIISVVIKEGAEEYIGGALNVQQIPPPPELSPPA